MSKHGKHIIASMEEAVAHAEGRPSKVRLHKLAPNEIREARLAMKMSQAEFAEEFHFSLPTVRKWEQGQREPSGPAMILLSIIKHAPSLVRRVMRDVR
jgi:putative transcriptional regulator